LKGWDIDDFTNKEQILSPVKSLTLHDLPVKTYHIPGVNPPRALNWAADTNRWVLIFNLFSGGSAILEMSPPPPYPYPSQRTKEVPVQLQLSAAGNPHTYDNPFQRPDIEETVEFEIKGPPIILQGPPILAGITRLLTDKGLHKQLFTLHDGDGRKAWVSSVFEALEEAGFIEEGASKTAEEFLSKTERKAHFPEKLGGGYENQGAIQGKQ
jgi:hypothetical protein